MVDMKVINSYFCLNRGAERKYTHLHVFFFTWKAAALAHTHIHKISTLYFPFFFFFFSFLPKHEAQFLKDTFRRDNTIIPSDGNEDYNILIE